MSILRGALAILGCLLLLLSPALGQRLVGSLSDRVVSINSTFSGETLTLFGNIEAEIGSTTGLTDGTYEVLVVVRGPAIDRVARLKTRELGIWLNTDQLVFRSFPSYFWVLSSRKLEDVADRELLVSEGLLPETRPQLAIVNGGGDAKMFGPELVRLMTEQGLFGVDESGVLFESDTLYSARVELPADVPNGNFLATTYLFQDGEIVARKSEGFSVRKTGFERFVGNAAQQFPWLYGLVCVLLALFTGWLGGVVFKR